MFFPKAYCEGSKEVTLVDCFGLNVDHASLRTPLSVNGIVNPTITMEPEEIKRLRIINASSGASFVPAFIDDRDGDFEIYVIAVDGIALQPLENDKTDMYKPYYKIQLRIDPVIDPARIWTTAEIWTLAPGQSLDILVKVKETASPTTVQVVDAGV